MRPWPWRRLSVGFAALLAPLLASGRAFSRVDRQPNKRTPASSSLPCRLFFIHSTEGHPIPPLTFGQHTKVLPLSLVPSSHLARLAHPPSLAFKDTIAVGLPLPPLDRSLTNPAALDLASAESIRSPTMAKTTTLSGTNSCRPPNGLPKDSAPQKHHQIPYIPLSYRSGDDAASTNASALALISALRPDWGSEVDFRRFTDGITNTLLQARPRACEPLDGESDDDARDREAILLRAYGNGTDLLIDRNREAQNHELLARHRLAPELLALFENGMLYRFIRGRVTSPQDLRRPDIYRAVARRLAQWHSTVPCLGHAAAQSLAKRPPPAAATNGHAPSGGGAPANGDAAYRAKIDNVAPGKLSPNVWTVIQKWILALPTETPAQRQHQATLQKELDRMVAELSQRPGLGKDGLVFAHCDLLSGNVIILPTPAPASAAAPAPGAIADEPNGACGRSAAPSASVTFIDYEYATPSPAAFDLANHFAEWGGFDCDYNVLPTRKQRREFIDEYVRAYFGGADSCTDQNGDRHRHGDSAARLFDEVDLFRGVPGFYWGIWALIQATISDIDFDYASYAETRLNEYWAWRAEQDGSRAAASREMPLRERRWAQEE
ncbi:hypothetical protein RB597_004471 [Gaeumannomyces tritici]